MEDDAANGASVHNLPQAHGEAHLQQWGNRETNHHYVHAHCVNGGLGHDHELFPKQATYQDAVDAVTRQRDTITRTAKSTYGPLETMHTDEAASRESSEATVEPGQEASDGEDSESDAPYTPELDIVFDALVELAGDGRCWVPVRQIQAQTSLQLWRLEELLEEWECMGVICRDDMRRNVAFGSSVADALEDEH